MCQLIGLSFNQEIQQGPYFRTLISRSDLHPHGWGLSCYPGDSRGAIIFKEPTKGSDSLLANFLCDYSELKSKTFIGHIRKASRGSVELDNTHPFARTYRGRQFVFVHNGTLTAKERLKRLTYQPLGTTDSERAFCFLLSQMRRREIKPVRADGIEGYTDTDFMVIHEILQEINVTAAGSFNCLFSDGQYLFSYRDMAEARYLFYRQYQGRSEKTTTPKFFTAKISHMENFRHSIGFVVATEPVDSGTWKSFLGGQFIVFRAGEVAADISCHNHL